MATETILETEVSLELTRFRSSTHEPNAKNLARVATLNVPDATDNEPNFLVRVLSGKKKTVLSNTQAAAVIIQLAGINFITSFSHGLITIGLPVIADSLKLEESLLVWPVSVFSLTTGSCLLLAGSFADLIGSRECNLVGSFLLALSIAACGLSQNGSQLIAFRAIEGVASALAVPSSISIVSTSVQSGRPRNIGFATLGLAQPFGFSAGLVLGGVLINGIGWRSGFYIGGATSFLFSFAGIWTIPKSVKSNTTSSIWTRLAKEPDWIGAIIASSCIAILSYVLAMLSSNIHNIKTPATISLLILSILLIPTFILWVGRQERLHKPALIPNSIWKKTTFTAICVMIMISTASLNCMELLSSLYFQKVQANDALGASIRILPNLVVAMILNLLVGLFVDRVKVSYLVFISTGLCAVAPVLMAVINPHWSYWLDAFFAQLLTPLSADVLYTVSIIVVSDSFPSHMQALAGAVFNTLAQLGTSIGLTSVSVVSSSITAASSYNDKTGPEALMQGYRAAFWMIFSLMAVSLIVGAYGLRRLGKIGEKRD